jgi:hypothetical protein
MLTGPHANRDFSRTSRQYRYRAALMGLLWALCVHASIEGQQLGERVYATAAESTFVLEASDSAGNVVSTATGLPSRSPEVVP